MIDFMQVKSPAVVKIYGEHAVVYGMLSVAAAIEAYATANVADTSSNTLDIALPQLGENQSFTRARLDALYASYKNRKGIDSVIKESQDISVPVLPYAVIAARLLNEHGVKAIGKRVEISSQIPVQAGCASSAACATAFTVALIKSSHKHIDEETVIDIARDGERIIHKSEGAGEIDVRTTYYGGLVSYSKEQGVKREHIDTQLDLVLIKTGPKKSTAETVGHVKEQYSKNREDTLRRLEGIDHIAKRGIEALKKGDMGLAGRLMLEDQELLRQLGVSSDRIDYAVSIAKQNNAFAKLTGGGGGGVVVALTNDQKGLIEVMKKHGFEAFTANVTQVGASRYLKNVSTSRQ
jgi:mevalonate kinase